MQIFFKHAWAFFIVVNLLNAFILKIRSKKYSDEDPSLKIGYQKAIRGLVVYGSLPWIIMGIGDIGGLTNNFFEIFDPKSLNPIVLAAHGSIILLWILSVYWVYFNNGAQFIENHPGIIVKRGMGTNTHVTAKQIKLFLPFILFGGAAAMTMMWFVELPIPNL